MARTDRFVWKTAIEVKTGDQLRPGSEYTGNHVVLDVKQEAGQIVLSLNGDRTVKYYSNNEVQTVKR